MHITKSSSRTPTTQTYTEFTAAYDFFNKRLFGGRLKSCLITLQRHRSAYGYFWADRFDRATKGKNKDGAVVDEIAMNPDTFRTRTVKDVLSTLVHEMVHLRQQHSGKPSRNGYHNKEWGRMMEEVGLTPSSTGMPGGKRTGQKVSHYINGGGAFDKACDELLKTGFVITWRAIPGDPKEGKSGKRSKYVCPTGGETVWGKAGLEIRCIPCKATMVDESADDEEEEGDDE